MQSIKQSVVHATNFHPYVNKSYALERHFAEYLNSPLFQQDQQYKMHIQINSVLILEIDHKNLKIVENILIKHIVIYLHPGSSNQIF